LPEWDRFDIFYLSIKTRANQPFGSTKRKDGNFAPMQKEVAQLALGNTCT
jgi:hypothetical protein